MLKPWQKTGSKSVGDYRIFTIRNDRVISPRTRREQDVFVIECVNWVNVVAITPDQRLVMVEQYRHGTNTVELEIPGGVMDAKDASPLATALRELKEETGYEGDSEKAHVIGRIFPNPAIMNNTAYTILVENCVEKYKPQFDPGEDLETRLVPLAEIPDLVRSGKIQHALVAVALFHFDLWQRQKK